MDVETLSACRDLSLRGREECFGKLVFNGRVTSDNTVLLSSISTIQSSLLSKERVRERFFINPLRYAVSLPISERGVLEEACSYSFLATFKELNTTVKEKVKEDCFILQLLSLVRHSRVGGNLKSLLMHYDAQSSWA